MLPSEVSQGFLNKTWVIINKLKIITMKESEAMFPTTGTFIQQPKSQAGRTHDETGAYQLEAHKVIKCMSLHSRQILELSAGACNIINQTIF